jgi:phosphatidylglycerol:prolipoprotein diacylglycerol transferase
MHQVAFHIFSYPVYWYGLAWCFSYLWVRFSPVKFKLLPKMDKDSWYEFIDYGLIAVVIGGRLGWVVFFSPSKLAQPLEILKVWQGGMSFHGALLSALLFIYCYGRYYKINAYALSDIVSLWIGPAIAAVRIANFYNGEVYGRVTSSTWGVIFPHIDMLYRHPSQLYEAFAEGFLLLLFLHHIKRNVSYSGQITAYAIIFYSTVRMLIETYFRAPSYEWTSVLSTGQTLCLMMLCLGLCIWLAVKKYSPLLKTTE